MSETTVGSEEVDRGFVGWVRSPGGATIPSDETAGAAATPSPGHRGAAGAVGGDRGRASGRGRCSVGTIVVVVPAEEFLEYLRMLGRSPNTVKSYARALALWWQFLRSSIWTGTR